MQTTEINIFSSSAQGQNLDQATQQTLSQYFQSLNHEQFDQTAMLFSAEGALVPPFERPIQGREAIAAYLKKEAVGITLVPHCWEPEDKSATPASASATEAEQDNQAQPNTSKPESSQFTYCVKGKVKTSLFSVHVAWRFQLNAEAQIDQVKVKLLASMKELMAMRPQS